MYNSATGPNWVYHARFHQIRYLHPMPPDSAANPLPHSLLLKPGYYLFQGQVYDLTNEGVYRLSLPPVENQQRIVFNGDLAVLLSSLTWLWAHGFSDRGIDNVMEVMLTRKLRLSCGYIHSLACMILASLGFSVHQVEGQPVVGRKDDGSDGHTALEVYHPGLKQWMFCDLDMKAVVMENEKPMPFLDMARALAEKRPVKVNYLSPATHHDISDISDEATGFDYTFMSEATLGGDALLEWYRHTFQVPLVCDHRARTYLFSELEHRQLIEGVSPSYKWAPLEEMLRRVYGPPPDTTSPA